LLISCKNCNGYFNRDEVMRLKAPPHPWKLTAVGERVLAENVANDEDKWPCPNCGQRTLRTVIASQSTLP
jgi:hypothetical protein